jgi:hypothetical protein
MSPTEPDSPGDPTVYDHIRPTDSADTPLDTGIYRVVGAGAETVTLLRVGDADASRVNTGVVTTVDRDDLDGFDTVMNPDGNRSTSDTAVSAASGFFWQFRAFAHGLRARPVAVAVALGAFAVGIYGNGILPVPGSLLTAVAVAGAVAVVLIGYGG